MKEFPPRQGSVQSKIYLRLKPPTAALNRGAGRPADPGKGDGKIFFLSIILGRNIEELLTLRPRVGTRGHKPCREHGLRT